MTIIVITSDENLQPVMISDVIAGDHHLMRRPKIQKFEDEASGIKIIIGIAGEAYALDHAAINNWLKAILHSTDVISSTTGFEILLMLGEKLKPLELDVGIAVIITNWFDSPIRGFIHVDKRVEVNMLGSEGVNAKSVIGSVHWLVARLPGYDEGDYLSYEDVIDRIRLYHESVLGRGCNVEPYVVR